MIRLREAAVSSGNDRSNYRCLLEAPFVTFYESLTPKTKRQKKRKSVDDESNHSSDAGH